MTFVPRAALAASMLIGFAAEAKPSYVSFDAPGATSTSPAADGTIAGNYTDGQTNGGFVRAPDGTMVTFTVPDAVNTQVTAMNDMGVITGSAVEQNAFIGFIRDAKGHITKISGAPNAQVFLAGINAKGESAGTSTVDNINYPGFIRDKKGDMTNFDLPGLMDVRTTAINKRREVVGHGTSLDTDEQVAFLRSSDGTVSTLPAKDALAINDKGTIVGTVTVSNHPNAVIIPAKGKEAVFDLSGSTGGTVARDITAEGTVVGYYWDGAGLYHGFRRTVEGKVTVIDFPKKDTGTVAQSINASGAVAGWYSSPSEPSTHHGFVGHP